MRSTIELINFSENELEFFRSNIERLSINDSPAILGLSILAHDTSAALVCRESLDVIFASAEERFSNIKHDSGFPFMAISKCLEAAEISGYRITEIAINFNPDLFITEGLKNRLSNLVPLPDIELLCSLVLELNLESSIDLIKSDNFQVLIKGIMDQFASIATSHTAPERELLPIVTWFSGTYLKYKTLGNFVSKLFSGIPITYIRHHDAHAATAYVGMGNAEATILVVDGHGESDTLSIYKFSNGNCLEDLKIHWPVSLGSLYLAATRCLGFDYGDEYKVMGMAAYGTVELDFIFQDIFEVTNGILKFVGNAYWKILSVRNTGMIRISPTLKLSLLLGKVSNTDDFSQIHFNFAHSLQKYLEKIMLEVLSSIPPRLMSANLGISGGVALNGLMNETIRRSGIFQNLFVYPAAGDDGTSVGAALYKVLENFPKQGKKKLDECYYGFSDESNLERILERYDLNFEKVQDVTSRIAHLLFKNEIVCRFTGAAEFGPRALGHRSILANPSSARNKDILNERIKHREKFRPFAPVVPLEYVGDYFEIDEASPFMLFITKARQKCKLVAPAVVHADGSARVQTVTLSANYDLYSIIQEFNKISGFPIIINTSFNLNGEAIVNNYQDAVESFMHMDVDFLAIDNYLVTKKEILKEESDSEFLKHRINRYFDGVGGKLRLIDCRARGEWFNS